MSAPNIRTTSNGDVVMKLTTAAEEAKRKYRSRPMSIPLPPIKANEDVHSDAKNALQREGVQQPDEVTLLGRYKIQRGQYYGHTFKWLLENDAGYAFYLWREHLKGPSPGKTDIEAVRATDNLSALVRYMSSFEVCNRTHQAIIAGKSAEVKAKQTGDPGFNILGFGKYHNYTYKDMLQSTQKEHQRYCRWVMAKTGLHHNSSMHRFQQYLRSSPPSDSTHTAEPTLPSTSAGPQPAETSGPSIPSASTDESLSWQKIVSPAQEKWMRMELKKLGLLPGTVEYMQQSRWLGQPLWRTPPPGELQTRRPHELPTPDSFWIHPMFVWCPEITFKRLLGSNGLPCITPDCNGQAEKKGLGRPRVVVGTGGGSTGMPNTGQYYILASTLHCKKCKCSPWAADQPAYLKMLPQSMQNLFPAVMTYRKAVCKSLVDQLRRSGRSPGDMAKEIEELLQLRYERAHTQYLHLLRTVREQALSGRNLDRAAGMDTSASSIPFGDYSDPKGYRGVSVSVQFLAGVLITEYEHQKPYLYGLMKGIFGRYWRADHTRTLANKVELLGGVMWSFCTFNEFWEVVSWVMVESDSETALANHYAGLAQRYETANVTKAAIRWVDKWCCVAPPYSSRNSKETSQESLPPCTVPNSAGVLVCVDRSTVTRQSACRQHYNTEMVELLDSFHCLRRFAKACTSFAHPAYPRFMSLLSSAFFIVDYQDLENLKKARAIVGAKGDPSKKEIRKHCRTVIPDPSQLETRVEAVIGAFQAVEDSNGIPLFKDNMVDEWKLQRTHIRRGCLSDPRICPVADGDSDEAGGVLYRLVDYVNFRGRESAGTRLPVWQPLRGTSQLEGFHPHQARWVTGTRVSPALFQAQAFLGLARWNWSRGTEHRKLKLPAFDPRLTAELNQAHVEEYAELKYPDFRCNSMETGEQFGIDYSQEVVSITSMDENDVHIQYAGDPCRYDETEMDDFDVDVATQQELEQMLACPQKEFVKPRSPILNTVTETATTAASPTAVAASPFITSMLPGQLQDPDVNQLQGSLIPNQQSSGHPSPAQSSSATSRPVPSLRKNTLSGMVTNWHPDKWTPAMVTVINQLLAEHSGKNRMDRVVTEYRKLVYASSGDSSSQLRMTNRHFIQLYERELNRRMEGQACINYSQEQTTRIGDLTSHLGETSTVPTHIIMEEDARAPENIEQVPPPDDPYDKKRPAHDSSSSSSDEGPQRSLVTEVTQAVIAGLGLTKKSKKKRSKKKKSKRSRGDSSDIPTSVPSSRHCSACGLPKSKVRGIGNLHHTYIRKGHPAFFYCPTKYSSIYGTPVTMTFEEFKTSEFWLPAVEAVQAEKRASQEKKAAAAKMREEKGWKKPGGPSKKK